MKQATLVTAAALMLSSIAHASQAGTHPVDTSLSEVQLRLVFESGCLSKSELQPIAAKLEMLLAADGSLDRIWLQEQALVQLEPDITPYSRLIKLTNGKKVLHVRLD